MKTRLVAPNAATLLLCGATVLPSMAAAQPVPDPTHPNYPYSRTPQIISAAEAMAPSLAFPNPSFGRATVVSTEPGYETVEDTWNAPVFMAGALIFATAYGGSVVGAAASSQEDLDRGNDRLYVPVVGPWLALNDRGSCPITRHACDHETTLKVLYVADGVFQGAGVLTMLAGLLTPAQHRVDLRTTARDKKLHVTPTAVGLHSDPGVAVFGRF
ncbi:MAG: hypothetical protein H6Q90_1205 [Deltaproteobacteria bacterium]|nr:hypothetical protein [Deltaproteobacteria bacterium]